MGSESLMPKRASGDSSDPQRMAGALLNVPSADADGVCSLSSQMTCSLSDLCLITSADEKSELVGFWGSDSQTLRTSLMTARNVSAAKDPEIIYN
ncbi:hypothetical protein IRJ41_010827 [Triplophysa rosa]|uniref:Uncharacterized protein n=1 Tax=Triplophysa rosa TaxID=992332 RepID=A0A9W8CCC0_TRIRA|nr:hypothetical protein IRJ41_010827 [Triplophysa rosa]